MRTIKLWSLTLIAAAVFFSLTACGNDDEKDNTVNVSDLVGDWRRVDDQPIDAYLVYSFTADKRFCDWEYDNNDNPIEPEEWQNYEVKGNIIYVSWDESSEEWEEGESNVVRAKILKLTATELTLQWEDPDDNGNMYWNDIYNFQKIASN